MNITILCPLHSPRKDVPKRHVFMAVPSAKAEEMKARICAKGIDRAGFLSVEAQTPGEIEDQDDQQEFLYRSEFSFGSAFNHEFGINEVKALEWNPEKEQFDEELAKPLESSVRDLQALYPWVEPFLVSLTEKAKATADFKKQFG